MKILLTLLVIGLTGCGAINAAASFSYSPEGSVQDVNIKNSNLLKEESVQGETIYE
jgi:hypothetical protein